MWALEIGDNLSRATSPPPTVRLYQTLIGTPAASVEVGTAPNSICNRQIGGAIGLLGS